MGERVMRKLDLSEWAHVAEVAGTIGVVVSLLLVVYSLERNTVSVSGSGVNEIYDGMREIQIAVLTDRELSEIIVQGREDPESLTTAEAMAYETWVAIHLDLWDRLHNRESDRFRGLSPLARILSRMDPAVREPRAVAAMEVGLAGWQFSSASGGGAGSLACSPGARACLIQ
jgi:hypothetical protein